MVLKKLAIGQIVLRLSIALAVSIALVTIGSVAMLFNTAPKWPSLIFEPFSLILLPGLAAGVMQTSPHDLEASLVVWSSVAFYTVILFAVLEWRARRRGRG